MKTLFFLKNAAGKASESNSVILRYYLKAIKKYKVKGLGISILKSDWNQYEQKIKRSNTSNKLFNTRLQSIEALIFDLEEKKGAENVTADDIDLIVESAIKGIEIKKIITAGEHINIAINAKIRSAINNNKSQIFIQKLNRLKDILEDIEKINNINITFDYINDNNLEFKELIINYTRTKGWSDGYTKDILVYINMCINYHNELHNKSIKTFILKSFKITKVEDKEAIYLNLSEIKVLYNFVFNPTEKQQSVQRIDLEYLKYYLVRCFSGVRVGDMNSNNFNASRVDDFFTKKYLLLYTGKSKKTVNIPFINDYLFRLCESLNWNFPTYKNSSDVSNYGIKESAAVKYYYDALIQNKRSIQVNIKGKGLINKPITPYLTSHTARKSFAMIIYTKTKSVQSVSKMLGHSSTMVTQKYLGVEDDYTAFEKMDLDI